jgi:hypothetical protein
MYTVINISVEYICKRYRNAGLAGASLGGPCTALSSLSHGCDMRWGTAQYSILPGGSWLCEAPGDDIRVSGEYTREIHDVHSHWSQRGSLGHLM